MLGSMSQFRYPARVHHVAEAEQNFGELLQQLLPYLDVGDEPADAVVRALEGVPPTERERLIEAALDGEQALSEPLARYVAGCQRLPDWVDLERLERASAIFQRSGLLGGITLGLCSLVHGYAAPAGNKPLAFSGRLTEKAGRRLAETGRFVTAVSEPRGMLPGGVGWRMTLKVRLMHAQVRRLLLASGRWQADAWSLPINQHDMLATVLLFSSVFLGGLRKMGFQFTSSEADDYQHLWRYVGWVMGVQSELLPESGAEAERLSRFIDLTQGPPDEDSRALVRALIDGPLQHARSKAERRRAELHVAVAQGLCRGLVGDELADALGLPRTYHRHLLSVVRRTLETLEGARLRLPRLNALVELLGARYWSASVAQGLAGVQPRFALPDRLAARQPPSPQAPHFVRET
jgi:hypothetical protein